MDGSSRSMPMTMQESSLSMQSDHSSRIVDLLPIHMNQQLNKLMMPAMLLSAIATVLSAIVNYIRRGKLILSSVNALIGLLLALVNYLKLLSPILSWYLEIGMNYFQLFFLPFFNTYELPYSLIGFQSRDEF